MNPQTYDDWLEQANQAGPAAGMKELEDLLDQAPGAARNSLEYFYLLGMFDMLLNIRELGGVKD